MTPLIVTSPVIDKTLVIDYLDEDGKTVLETEYNPMAASEYAKLAADPTQLAVNDCGDRYEFAGIRKTESFPVFQLKYTRH
ncbi:MAG TPA: hypothetical protein VJJ20_03330 [Candidatus Paceibacterota bacterium]